MFSQESSPGIHCCLFNKYINLYYINSSILTRIVLAIHRRASQSEFPEITVNLCGIYQLLLFPSDFASNAIQSLPEGIFTTLTSLREL